MKLSAKDQSYFEKEAKPNLPPNVLSTMAWFKGLDEWENDMLKVVHYDYDTAAVWDVVVANTVRNTIEFWKVFPYDEVVKVENTIYLLDET